MPFEKCACHVWAIDGYINDDRADQVHSQYDNQGGQIPEGLSLNDRVGQIVGLVRTAVQSDLTNESIVIYGGFFNANDATPAHMWFALNDEIYETMPGARLYLSSRKGYNPAGTYKGVGECSSVLTKSQAKYLRSARKKGLEAAPWWGDPSSQSTA